MSKKIGVFVDYDNQQLDVFSLIELLREKGRVVIRRAYADWVSRQSYRKSVVQAGFELIDCPKVTATHKNAADIRLVVDCLSISYEYKDIDIYVFVTGDVDFVPLINKLRTMGKETVVVAANSSAADLLQQACDEYIPANRLDVIETISKGQLNFEESLNLLQKACEQLKLKGYDKDAQDVKSMIKQKMLQLNPSFDEKDYEDCNSFTSYLQKSRMFINLDNMFGSKSEVKTEPSEVKELQQFPDTLLIKVYNEALRRWGEPVTMQKFEKMLFGIHQDISLKLYGVKNTKQLITGFKDKGLLHTDGSKIEIEPDVRFKLTLMQLKFYHKPEIRKIVISKIISLAKNWDVENKDLTLNELKKSSIDVSESAISRADFDGIINLLKIGGVFFSPDNVPVTSLNIPLHLISYKLNELEDIVLSMSIFRLVNSSNVENSDKELGALADLLLGSDSRTKINEIEKLLDKLEKDKKIIRKKNFWIKFRK
ncbi:MAG: NYN domain-containing protein [Candidatus Aminicenantes bacterium]|nr:NYN domain-containing protein [Candidatus Aminicenantes bacterium]